MSTKTLPGQLGTLVNGLDTEPGHLVQLGFPAPLYFSTGINHSVLGANWVARSMQIEGLSSSHKGEVTLTIDDSDQLLSALILNSPVAGNAVIIYTIDEQSPSDAMEVCRGVIDGVTFPIDKPVVILGVIQEPLKSPRRRTNESSGVTVMIARGTKITIGNQTYVLER